MKKIISTILFGILIPNTLFSFSEDDMMYSYKNNICTKTSKESREILINAVNYEYIKIAKSVSIISGTLHELHFRNQVGKEYIVYVMSTYGSCIAFDFLVKNPNVDFDISKTVGLKDPNAMN